MADSKRESRVVNPIVHTADGKFVGCGNEACYCTGQCMGFDREEITFRKQIDSAYKAFGNNDKPSDISIKVTADVNEAITGLKALSRELREATKVARELEQAYSDVGKAKDLREGNVIIDGKKVAKAVYATDFGLSTHRDLSEVPTEVLREELSRREREGLK